MACPSYPEGKYSEYSGYNGGYKDDDLIPRHGYPEGKYNEYGGYCGGHNDDDLVQQHGHLPAEQPTPEPFAGFGQFCR